MYWISYFGTPWYRNRGPLVISPLPLLTPAACGLHYILLLRHWTLLHFDTYLTHHSPRLQRFAHPQLTCCFLSAPGVCRVACFPALFRDFDSNQTSKDAGGIRGGFFRAHWLSAQHLSCI